VRSPNGNAKEPRFTVMSPSGTPRRLRFTVMCAVSYGKGVAIHRCYF